jgi:DNA ligase-1
MQNIINEIRSDNSKNFKIATLKDHADNTLFREVVLRAYSPLIRFGISVAQIPEYTSTGENIGLESALIEIDKLSRREITGNAAKTHIASVLSKLSEEDAEVIKLILGKSLKLGCNSSSINKAWGRSTIPSTPYMGAVSYDSKKVEKLFNSAECVSQQKADGRYLNLSISGGQITTESRQGLPSFFPGAFDCCAAFEEVYGEGLVLNGELLISGMEKDRYTSNGIIASLVSIGDKIENDEDVLKELKKFEKRWSMSYEAALGKLKVELWDFIPMHIYIGSNKWDVPYRERMAELNQMIEKVGSEKVSFIESRHVKNEAEAKRHFIDMLDAGNEGTILKSLDSPWTDNKPVTQIKYKNEILIELFIKGFNLGSGKNSGVISSLNTASSCGKLKTSPGGMSEALMAFVTENIEDLIDQVVTVKCNGISKNKYGEYSVLHPVVETIRDDKDEADSLEQCLAIHNAALSLGDIGLKSDQKNTTPSLSQNNLF